MPNEQKGPSESNHLQEFITALLAVFIAKTDSFVVDVMLIAVTGYLLVMDYEDRRNR
ncbi:hypothetical protein [Bifidobacterium sp. ESL0704]|uniref:hypothetical protein n=1 Tax=Bifidobacterium sp. ESL0704 TaxID=2983219 RepID=UPI0023F6FC46|nr:hypothetical protein [Bifidobacterium sp. ESL0704]WEV52846.1 hypothetical protein OZX64_08325 [Bifidobacterium sp. ESL0704]